MVRLGGVGWDRMVGVAAVTDAGICPRGEGDDSRNLLSRVTAIFLD